MSLEYKSLALDQKQALEALSADPGQLIGYASVFNGVDAYNDTILPGAYAATIPSFVQRGTLHAEHDTRIRLGTITSAQEDDHGLLIVSDFHSTPEAQSVRTQILERMQRGKFVGLSIGYLPEDFETREDGVRVLKQIKLYEVSEVTVPADEMAGVIAAKSAVITDVKRAPEAPQPSEPAPPAERIRLHMEQRRRRLTRLGIALEAVS